VIDATEEAYSSESGSGSGGGIRGWLEAKWRRWDANHSLTALHPTHPPAYWRTIAQPLHSLPPSLRSEHLKYRRAAEEEEEEEGGGDGAYEEEDEDSREFRDMFRLVPHSGHSSSSSSSAAAAALCSLAPTRPFSDIPAYGAKNAAAIKSVETIDIDGNSIDSNTAAAAAAAAADTVAALAANSQSGNVQWTELTDNGKKKSATAASTAKSVRKHVSVINVSTDV
jgi:hypothetical protein